MWLLPPSAHTPSCTVSCGWKLEKMTTPARPKVWVITRSLAVSVRNHPLFLPDGGLTTKSLLALTSPVLTSSAW